MAMAESTGLIRRASQADGRVVLADGDYEIHRPIPMHSNTIISGAGVGQTRIVTAPDFVGDSLFRLLGGSGDSCQNAHIKGITLISSVPGVAGIRQAARSVANCSFSQLALQTNYGIMLDSYTQCCRVADIFSSGPVDQLLCLAGNANMVDNLDHEGDCGTSSEPFILFKGHAMDAVGYSTGNRLSNVIIEGNGNIAKTIFVLRNLFDVTLENLWGETNYSSGYQLDIADCIGVVHVRQNYGTLASSRRVKIARTDEVLWKVANLNAQMLGIDDVFEIDDVSHLTIERLHTRDARDVYRPRKNLAVRRSYNQYVRTQAVPGFWPSSQVVDVGANLLINPSFESGVAGWTVQDAPTITAPASPCGGLAARFVWATATDHGITQTVTVAPEQVGQPYTFAARVSAVAGSATVGAATVYVEGCGIPYRNYSQARVGSGWQIVSQTFTPLAAGDLHVGISAYYLTELFADACALRAGTVAMPDTTGAP